VVPEGASRSRTHDNTTLDTVGERSVGMVLIIDDEPSTLQIVRLFLEEIGFTVLVAEDGRRGLEAFKAHADEIAAVVLDLSMPVMDGVATFKALLEIRRDVPVILVSGYAEPDVAQRFAGQPCAGFLQKPYRIGSLVAKLRDLLAPRVV
jgi:two-component system, cell cycle sensor histidine kinase and response regulator CckA